MMKIETIKQAEEFIFNYNWYESRSRNQTEELSTLQHCEQIAIQHQHKKLLYRTRAYLTSYYTQANELALAIKIGTKNYEDCQKHNYVDELLLSLSFLISISHILGNFAQSETYLNICKEYVYQLNDIKKICNTHITSAIQYNHSGDIDKCIQENETALKFAQQLNDTYTIATIYNNYAYHVVEKFPDKAEQLLNAGVQIIHDNQNEQSNYDFILAHYYLNYAIVYNTKKDLDKTIHFAIKAMQCLQQLNIIDSCLEAEAILADVYLQQNNFEQCLQHLIQIETTALQSESNPILLKAYNIFHELFERKTQYKNAYTYLKKYLQVKEKIYNQETEKTIRNLQITNEVKTYKIQKENAERIGQLKHEFLANMSHEIRTPINSIIGICYLLHQDELTEKQKNYVHRLEKSGENLLGIITEILDISKIEIGKLELNPTPNYLYELLSNTCQILAINAENKGLKFSTDFDELKDVLVLVDAIRFNQIFNNILSNAIKFTPTGSITVQAHYLQRSQKKVNIEFTVSDTGIGIPPNKMEHLFDRYKQADVSIHAKYGGTGLGLPISKSLVDLMGGTIHVKSEINQQTTFTISLEFKTISKNDLDTKKEIPIELLRNKTILIVDDLEDNRNIMKEILVSSKMGLNILEATNGKLAIESVQRQHPDIILMDLDMPEMNGFEATQHLRKKYPDSKIKIIITTASLLTTSVDELIEMGFNGILHKPIKPELLFETLCELIETEN